MSTPDSLTEDVTLTLTMPSWIATALGEALVDMRRETQILRSRDQVTTVLAQLHAQLA